MYLIWRADIALTTKYFYVNRVPVGLKTRDWKTGERMSKAPPLYTLRWDGKSPSALSDVLLAQFRLPILSPKAIAVLDELGVDNLQYFPIAIDKGRRRGVERSYEIANVVGLVHCLDRKHAKIETFPGEKDISWLERFRIIERKIKPLKKGKKPPLIFRLGEFTSYVLAHESVQHAFDDAGVTGAEFIRPEKLV